jgi:hypothetical protein
MTSFARSAAQCVFLLGLLLSAATAQDAPVVRTGNIEVGGFVGASYGIDEFRVMGGGNVAYALTRHIMPYVEYSYFPRLDRTVTDAGTRFNYSFPLNDFHAGVHLRVPIRESRIVPYGVFGLGGIHAPASRVSVVFPDGTRIDNRPVPSSTDFAVNFGGGLRYYLNERFGFRVEAKAYKPTGNFTDVFGKVEGGFFFQIR